MDDPGRPCAATSREVVALVAGPPRARRAVLDWAGRYAGRTGTVHVICDDPSFRTMVNATTLLSLVANVESAAVEHPTHPPAEYADFACAAKALAPYGSCWTWQCLAYGAYDAALRRAREIGAVAVLPRQPWRRPSRPIQVIEPRDRRPATDGGRIG
jgi:hypothetical protein